MDVQRRRRGRVVGASAALSAAALTTWVIGWSPFLRVSHVLVDGARHTGDAAVVRAAALDQGDHLFLLPADEIAQRVEMLPWVRSAEVDRILPGRVRITVGERRPAAVLVVGARRWTVDAGGRVLTSGEAAAGLPVLTGADGLRVSIGRVLEDPAARDALRAWKALPGRVRTEVRGIVAPTLERITFVLEGGTQVRYGAAEQLRAKNSVLLVVLQRIRDQGRTASYVDVRVPANPAVRFADGGGTVASPGPTGSPAATPVPSPSG